MKVILTQDIDTLGAQGEVVDVSNGYARNYLLPKKMAQQATDAVLRHYEERKKAIATRVAREIEVARASAQELESKRIVIQAKVGEEGKLYGTVTSKEIVQALYDQLKLEVDKKKIEISAPIRHVGEHTAELKLHSKVTARLTIVVEAQGD